MHDDLDLSGKGDGEEAAPQSPGKKSGGAEQIYTRPDRAERRWEQDLRGRLERTLQRLTEWLEGRGDLELAEVFKEDGKAMIGGMIALARPAQWLRPILVWTLTVAEPLLAFGRLSRVLLGRWAYRRQLREEDLGPEEAEEEGQGADEPV